MTVREGRRALLRRAWRRPAFAGWLAGVASAGLFLTWWLGWYPGVIGAEEVRQLEGVRSLDFSTLHPPLHSYLLWALSAGGRVVGAFTLAQTLALATLFGLVAARLTRLGLAAPVAGVAVGLVALLPAVSVAAITPRSEVTFTVVAVWLFAELLALIADGAAFWQGWRGALRLGVPLAGAAAFGAEGLVAFAVVSAALIATGEIGSEARRRLSAVVAGGIAAGWLILPLGVDRDGGDLPRSLAPTVAASLVHHPGDFPGEDLAFVERIAPLEVWTAAYTCADPVILVSDRQFDASVIEDDVAAFTGVAVRAAGRHPLTAIGQRGCAALNILEVRHDPGTAFHLPPYTIPVNEDGVERRSIWFGAFTASKAVLLRTQQTDRLWLWWRPALPLAAAALVYGVLVWRRRSEVLVAAVLIGTLLGILIVRPSPDFATTAPLYVLGWLSVPLVGLRARVSPVPSARRGPPAS